MGFSEDFAGALDGGFTVDPGVVPTPELLGESLGSTRLWLDGLEPATRDAVNEVTREFRQNAALADESVGIAPGLSGLYQAADEGELPLSIAEVVRRCDEAMSTVLEA